jgi:hypothetical protein
VSNGSDCSACEARGSTVNCQRTRRNRAGFGLDQRAPLARHHSRGVVPGAPCYDESCDVQVVPARIRSRAHRNLELTRVRTHQNVVVRILDVGCQYRTPTGLTSTFAPRRIFNTVAFPRWSSSAMS